MNDRKKMNIAIAGYHMLQIMCAADNEFNAHEDALIREYLAETFPFDLNLDHEMETLSALHPDNYMKHFTECMNDFYADSTEKERTRFFDMVVKLAVADKKITREENNFVDALYDAWEPSRD